MIHIQLSTNGSADDKIERSFSSLNGFRDMVEDAALQGVANGGQVSIESLSIVTDCHLPNQDQEAELRVLVTTESDPRFDGHEAAIQAAIVQQLDAGITEAGTTLDYRVDMG